MAATASVVTLPPQALALDPNLARYLNQDQILPACQTLMSTLSKTLAPTGYSTGDDIPRRLHSQLTDICNAFFGSNGRRGWLHKSLNKTEENAIRALFNPSGPLIRQLFRGCNRDDLLFQVPIDKLPPRWKTIIQEGRHLELPNSIRIRLETSKTINRPGTAINPTASMTASTTASLLGKHPSNPAGKAPIVEQATTFKLYMLEYWMFCFIRSLTTGTGSVFSTGGNYVSSNESAIRPSGPPTIYQELAIDLLHYFLPLPDKLSKKASGVFESRTLDSYVDQAVRMDSTLFLFTVAAECWLPSVRNYNSATKSSSSISFAIARFAYELVAHVTDTDLRTLETPSNENNIRLQAYGSVKNSVYNIVRERLYPFLYQALETCPLDATYEEIVSIWLIYLTPWHMFVEKNSKDQAILKPNELEKQWKVFILDNLLFYTRLVQIFLQRASQFDVIGRQEKTTANWPNSNTYGIGSTGASPSAQRSLNWRVQCRLVERLMEKLGLIGLIDILKEGEIIMLNKDGDMIGNDIAALSRHPMVNTTATVIPSHRTDTKDVVLRARWHQLSSEKYDCLYLTVRPHATIMRALAHFRLAEKSCQEKLKELDPLALVFKEGKSPEEVAQATAALTASQLNESFIQKAITTVKKWRQGDQHERKVQQLQRYIRVIGGVADNIQTAFKRPRAN
ncbi:hypothetical protein BDF19DRAFT_277434 [Syncephalis fuscata]|nr:hypothetical protein BDF19DRAFT_277434 [Syncephalis fuscata]